MEEFGEHVQRMHADRDKWFEQEYNVRTAYLKAKAAQTKLSEYVILKQVHILVWLCELSLIVLVL